MAERTLFLNGTIAEESWFDDDVTPQLFKDELMSGSGNITVWINSPGGDCVAAAQIYNMLMDYKGDVTVKIDGIAASAASVIAMAGTKVLVSPVSMLMQCVSIFSSRIICGDCGGYYGRKIWHSSTKYTAWHWHCNAKFQKRKHCETPTLKEESFEEAFVEVFNGLIADKDEIMENYRLCINAVTDDSEYRRQLEDLNNGCGEVQMLIRSLLMTYSRQDTADDIHEKLQEYEERLDTMARLKQELDLKIAACAAKRVQITGFLNELMKHDAPLAKFDPLVWQAVINYATVNRNCTITFTFRDGTEKTVPIKNGVRPYTKRNKPQEVDGNDG